MEDGTSDALRVRFPAVIDYLRIGRVAVAGLALRLDVDVQRVERLRLAVDAAVEALSGRGEIEVRATWEPGILNIEIENTAASVTPEQSVMLKDQLVDLVDRVEIDPHQIELELSSDRVET